MIRKIILSLLVVAVFSVLGTSQVLAAADDVVITLVGDQNGTAEYGTTSVVTFLIEASGDGEGDVVWSVTSGLPLGVSPEFSPAVTSGTGGTGIWSTTLTLTSDDDVDPGTYNITVEADGDGSGDPDEEDVVYTIVPKTIDVDAITALDKVYDSTIDAGVIFDSGEVFVSDDDVDLVGEFATKDAGVGKEVLLSLVGDDASKYLIFDSIYATITPVSISITAGTFAVSERTYDGTAFAALSADGVVINGVLDGDIVEIDLGVGTFADKHVGEAKEITFSGFTAGGLDGGNYVLDQQPANEFQDVNPAPLTVRPEVESTKIYDGTTDSSGTPEVTVGEIFAGDTGNFTQTYDNKNVGTGKEVTTSGLVDDGNGGANYVVSHMERTDGIITAKEVTLNLQVNTKVYDQSTEATLGDVFSLSGVVEPDDVSAFLSGVTAEFEDENAGVGKNVTITGASIVGDDASNYTLATPVATGTISPRPVSISFVAEDKVYDGDADAAIDSESITSGVIDFDEVILNSDGVATFEDKNVGVGKVVSASGFTLSGAQGGNYEVGDVATTTADITPLALTVTATGNNKVYDGNATATVTFEDDRVDDDDITVLGTALFDNKNVGTEKMVEVTGISLVGDDALNYTPNLSTDTTADITPRTLTVTIEADDKVYDGNTDAVVTFFDDRVPGDNIAVLGTAEFEDEFAGEGKTVTVNDLSLIGDDASNYELADTTAEDNDVEITRAPLTIAFEVDNKVYDGGDDAIIASSSIVTPLIGEDDVSVSDGTAIFDNKNVGVGKLVTADEFTLNGDESDNYYIETVLSTAANITPLALTVTATGINKVYDGNATATVTFEDDRIDDDDITVFGTALFDNKSVGTEKMVSVTGIYLTGDDAGNYTPNLTTDTIADITVRELVVTVSGVDKVFDGNTDAAVIFNDNRVMGDILAFSGVSTFADPEIGFDKEVTTVNIVVSGLDASNYSANETATTTASILEEEDEGGTTYGTRVEGRRSGFAPAPVGQIVVSDTTSTSTIPYQFFNDLYFGLFNFEVIMLQQILIDKGFLLIEAPTGYFGPLTQAAVKLYQASNGIINTGYVGPLTRAALNAGL